LKTKEREEKYGETYCEKNLNLKVQEPNIKGLTSFGRKR
jgi:hypothetical protein